MYIVYLGFPRSPGKKKNKIGKNILVLRDKDKYVCPLNCELKNGHLFMISGCNFYIQTQEIQFFFLVENKNLSKY